VGKLTDLQTLRLNETNLYGNDSCYLTTGPETIAALASALTALPHLVELDLCGNSMQSEAADVLVRALQHLTGLTRLKLFETQPHSKRRLEAESATALAGTLTRLTQLTELELTMGWSSNWSDMASGDARRLPEDSSLASPEAVAAMTEPLVALMSLTKLATYGLLEAESATAWAGTLTRLTPHAVDRAHHGLAYALEEGLAAHVSCPGQQPGMPRGSCGAD
jgi:hypothetical protein